jgi:cell division protein FtsZ
MSTTIHPSFIPSDWESSPNIITVIGVGGGGGNAVNYMQEQGIKDVNYAICNTDSQALEASPVTRKVQLGEKGLGAGTEASVGRKAAESSIEEISQLFKGKVEMAFITCGMGGGTGTGAAPIIAEVARKANKLTVGVVTLPFRDEGEEAMERAIEGIKDLNGQVDSILIIDNQKLYDIYPDLNIFSAFHMADEVLCTAVKSIAEVITKRGFINADFADVKRVMSNSGVAMMGMGRASGENRAVRAVEIALQSPLLNNIDLSTAKNAIVNITGSGEDGHAPSTEELRQIMEEVRARIGSTGVFKRGLVRDDSMGEEISVTVIATGFAMTQLPVLSQRRKNVISVTAASAAPKHGTPVYPQEEIRINRKQAFEGVPSLIVTTQEELNQMAEEAAYNRRERLIEAQQSE